MIEPFSPEIVASHALMCFEFNDGGMVAKDGSKDNRLVVSIEARLKEGQGYSLVAGDPVITQPDQTLFPDKQKKLSKVGQFFRAISKSGAYHVMSSLAGFTAGALLGSAICPPIGTLVGGVVGGVTGERLARKIELKTNFTTEPAEQY